MNLEISYRLLLEMLLSDLRQAQSNASVGDLLCTRMELQNALDKLDQLDAIVTSIVGPPALAGRTIPPGPPALAGRTTGPTPNQPLIP